MSPGAVAVVKEAIDALVEMEDAWGKQALHFPFARVSRAKDGLREVAREMADSGPATTPLPFEISEEMLLAGARVISPQLFRHGLEPRARDGDNTRQRMTDEIDLVRRILKAALGQGPHQE